MKQIVRDIMVPVSEYATVHKDATLLEAVLVLEKMQENRDETHHKYRAVLVLDNQNKVVGKLGQLEVIQALDLGKDHIDRNEDFIQFGFSKKFVTDLMKRSRLGENTLSQICRGPADMKVENFMKTPLEHQYVEEGTSLEVAIYQFLTGPFLSLMVVRDNNIVGILRLMDIFLAVARAMKENEQFK